MQRIAKIRLLNLRLNSLITFSLSRTMATQIIQVPKMGDSITEGTLIKTVKQPGEQVALDEIVCVIETDKVSFTSLY
jgi:hypothetical protein